jgi:hypothetical protein
MHNVKSISIYYCLRFASVALILGEYSPKQVLTINGNIIIINSETHRFEPGIWNFEYFHSLSANSSGRQEL